jgi:hypothetical protein
MATGSRWNPEPSFLRSADGDEGGGNRIAGVLDGCTYPVAALTHGTVGQADGVEDVLLCDNATVVNLNIDEVGVNSIDGGTENFK